MRTQRVDIVGDIGQFDWSIVYGSVITVFNILGWVDERGRDRSQESAKMASKDKKLVRSKSGLRIVASDDCSRSPFELSEPPWIPDNECLQCMECRVRFDFMKRRHHCRRCGRIYCAACCSSKLTLPRMCFIDPVRLCDHCAEITRKEMDFFDKHLKTLTAGANFQLTCSSNLPDNVETVTYMCKLSPDHRQILFECDKDDGHEPILLDNIEMLNVVKSSDDFQEQTASGLHIQYARCEGDVCNVKLTIAPTSNRKQVAAWIAALVKAIKMVYEGRIPSSP